MSVGHESAVWELDPWPFYHIGMWQTSNGQWMSRRRYVDISMRRPM
jgi:hypothetical protein